MGTFSVVTTVSHRYYAKRRKSETIRLIRDLEKAAGVEPRDDLSEQWRASELADYAMRLHRMLPEGD
jgi:hypothetical protein